MKKYFLCVIAASLMTLSACQKKGAAEQAGERVDEVVDNVKHGDNPLKKKGPIEKMGESIDDTFKSEDK